jgi:hypothetical protein
MKIKSNPSLTILTIVFGLLLFYFFLDKKELSHVCLFISGVGVFSSKLSVIIEKIWFKLSFLLSQIIPNILLFIIFFFILTPFAFLSKVFNAETDFSSKNNKGSNFKTLNKIFDKRSFEKNW